MLECADVGRGVAMEARRVVWRCVRAVGPTDERAARPRAEVLGDGVVEERLEAGDVPEPRVNIEFTPSPGTKSPRGFA